MPSSKPTPEPEIQSSRPPNSTGTVSARTGSPGLLATGIRGEISCQRWTTSSIFRPSVSASATPVIVVAAVFQSRITPSRSTRTTPSPTASSARAARLRRSDSA